MKHKLKITLILLFMFLLTQFIGLYVVNYYQGAELPYGLEISPRDASPQNVLPSMFISFIIAIFVIFLLIDLRIDFLLKIWFFSVVVIALGISFNSVFYQTSLYYLALFFAIILASLKMFNRDFFSHNFSELFIYPGIAAVFVPLLNVYSLVFFLILISVYDIWAVWHSGVMQKMAKYQMDSLKVFGGFFLPYFSKSQRKELKELKKLPKHKRKNKKMKVRVAILGGGDVIFPIISAGVMLKTLGMLPAIFVILGATLGLSYLLFRGESKEFYPAMPYISIGILLGILAGYIHYLF
jgi:presenilin-like A22 family membrane protease